ncbi:MAG: DNA polymerase domain-containing protein [Chloroflexota bacterium]
MLERLREGQNEALLEVDGYQLLLKHLDSVYWPGGEGRNPVTKRDYLRYLISISPLLINHMMNRPVTLIRFPHGANAAWSFQRYWEGPAPPFVETVTVYSERDGLNKCCLMCNNLATLLWLGDVANLEMRPWFSRIVNEPDAVKLSTEFTGSTRQLDRSVLNYPDFMVFDLDPYFYSLSESNEMEAERIAFRKCCEVAFWLKEILESLSLPPYVKTSGRSGLHIFVPILRNMDYTHVRSAAAAIAWLLLEEHPQDVTTEWSVARRTGKLLLDYHQNQQGKTFLSAYSPAADQWGLVSMPVRWEELDSLNPGGFTMEAALERVHSVGGDLWGSILDEKVDMSHMYMPPI